MSGLFRKKKEKSGLDALKELAESYEKFWNVRMEVAGKMDRMVNAFVETVNNVDLYHLHNEAPLEAEKQREKKSSFGQDPGLEGLAQMFEEMGTSPGYTLPDQGPYREEEYRQQEDARGQDSREQPDDSALNKRILWTNIRELLDD